MVSLIFCDNTIINQKKKAFEVFKVFLFIIQTSLKFFQITKCMLNYYYQFLITLIIKNYFF